MARQTRAQLDEEAIELGILDAPDLPNMKAVREAIAEAAEPPPVDPALFEHGCRVISVFGPFNTRAMVEMPAELAAKIFAGPLPDFARTNAVDATEVDLALIREVDPTLADSAIAATAVRMAYELEDPYNSATSKAQCAKALAECMGRLWDQVPEKPKEDVVARIQAERASRRAAT
jgi:hypothetical protein